MSDQKCGNKPAADIQYVSLGRVSGLHGVQGWVKVHSDTSPRENILSYKTWYLKNGDRWEPRKLKGGRRQGKSVVAKLEGCDDRDRIPIRRVVIFDRELSA